MGWIFFNKRICSFLTELTVGKAKVVRPEQIRLLLERATRFAGGGSHRFNHFHAELATGQICSPFGVAGRPVHVREYILPRKIVDFLKVWQLYRLGFDFGVGMWYSEEKEGSAPGRLRFWLITASRLRPLAVISYSLSLKYERAAITVPATVATHVTNPTTNSAVICKPPSI